MCKGEKIRTTLRSQGFPKFDFYERRSYARGKTQMLRDDALRSRTTLLLSLSQTAHRATSRHPYVFYELGIAHALKKDVILITKDSVGVAPSDIRHFEFIHYELENHVEFLKRLDNALRNVFAMEYENLYGYAENVFNEFRQAMSAQVDVAPKEVFIERVMAVESKLGLPPMDDALAVAQFVLPRIIADATDLKIATHILTWISQKWQTP